MDVVTYRHDVGVHNSSLKTSTKRIEERKGYQDLSTVIVCVTRGMIPAKVVESWIYLMRPINQRSIIGPLFVEGMEVAEGYNYIIDKILKDPLLCQCKYVLTIEEDNIPPPDGLLKLYENIDKYDVVGGLYWTKGKDGIPMIFGDPSVTPKNYFPQMPIENGIQPANGLGMGFNLFKLDMFRNIPYPWFKNSQEYDIKKGSSLITQDLYFYGKASELGYKFACDTSIRVGHYDSVEKIVW